MRSFTESEYGWGKLVFAMAGVGFFAFMCFMALGDDAKARTYSETLPVRFEVVERVNFLRTNLHPTIKIVRDTETLVLYYFYSNGHGKSLTRCWECEYE